MRPLFPYMKKYRWGYFWGVLSVFANNGTAIMFPIVIGKATQDLIGGVTERKLATYSLELIGLVFLKGIFQFLTRWIMIGISRDIEFDLRNDLFRRLELLSYNFYQRTRTGDIMARATNDLNAVRMLLGPAIMYSANTAVLMVGGVIYMLSISPKLTLFSFAPLPIASIVVQYFGRKIHDRFEALQAMFSDLTSRTQENFSGVRVVRAYAQEDAEIARFERDNQEYINRSLPLVRLTGMLWPTLEFMLGIAIVAVLWLGSRQVLQGRIQVGQLISFLTLTIQLTWPVIAVGWVVNIFQRGAASMGRFAELLHEESAINDAEALKDNGILSFLRGEIEFRNLNFAYNDTPVLRDVNLRIPAGTSLAIVGPTGSGKSTLVSLIPRIYDAERGSVLIDGHPIRHFPLETLRSNIGFVAQETFLFSDTIRENIAFGADDATMDDVRASAEAASIAQDIESFPEKYDTTVGERGITLSGGQKQRTAIARAIIRNPRILILDDALASVDTHTEDKILNHLREIMEGRTTIFISHRVSTVRNADRIVVLHGGCIVEYGTHDELLALNGYYTDLYNKQLLEEELAGV